MKLDYYSVTEFGSSYCVSVLFVNNFVIVNGLVVMLSISLSCYCKHLCDFEVSSYDVVDFIVKKQPWLTI